jgi:tetratricopeptide (TPR) repeat protein
MMTAYKAILSLNNTATSLMQLSSFDQAFDTLKDAVHLIRASQQGNRGYPEHMVHRKLNEATRRIASSTYSTATSSFKVVSHNDADFEEGSIKSSKQQQLIRFDTTDSDLVEQQEGNLDLCAAIILYNFGLCAVKLGRQEGGIKYLAYALQLLQGIFDSCQDEPFLLKRIVFISEIVLTTLIPAQLSRGMTDEAQENTETLNYLAEVACSLRNYVLLTHDFPCAAAA